MYKLFKGDCFEKLRKVADGSVDLVLTDPPYGMSFQSNSRKEKYDKIQNDDNLDWIDDFTDLIYRKLKDNSHAYIFGSFHHVDIFKQALEKKFELKSILIWSKNNGGMGDLVGNYAPTYELIFYISKGKKPLNGQRDTNILRYAGTGNRHHPTEKPVDLMEFLIRKSTHKGDTVLDCFMGSGPTGVACMNTKRNFIGIELMDEYFNTAKGRIEEAYRNG